MIKVARVIPRDFIGHFEWRHLADNGDMVSLKSR